MIKHTIKLFTEESIWGPPNPQWNLLHPDHFYPLGPKVLTENECIGRILDGLVNWSQEGVNHGRKIYRHHLRAEVKPNAKFGSTIHYYLDIYSQ